MYLVLVFSLFASYKVTMIQTILPQIIIHAEENLSKLNEADQVSLCSWSKENQQYRLVSSLKFIRNDSKAPFLNDYEKEKR